MCVCVCVCVCVGCVGGVCGVCVCDVMWPSQTKESLSLNSIKGLKFVNRTVFVL